MRCSQTRPCPKRIVSVFERDSQFLAYFDGSPSFILFVVEAFFRLMLPRVWLILLAVFAFVFHPAFCQLAASAQLAVVFATLALTVSAASASALVVFLLFLALLLFAPARILVH